MTTAHDVFSGRTAVITGAGSGIGKGLAQHAASLGMNLVLADVDETRLEILAKELPGEVLTVVTDVADGDAVDHLAAAAFERFGSVELVVNNAGIMRIGYSWALSADDWNTAIDVNLRGAVNGIRSFVPRLLAQGTPAHVVSISSVGGFAWAYSRTLARAAVTAPVIVNICPEPEFLEDFGRGPWTRTRVRVD